MNKYGIWEEGADVAGMFFPVKCKWCGNVHDMAKVTVHQRYSDCTTWRCPGCKVLLDDRPMGWGGSAIKLDRFGREVD